MLMKKIIIIISLIVIDQIVKLFISNFIGDKVIHLIPGFLHIHPILNEINSSGILPNYKFFIGIEIVVTIIVFILFIFLYRFWCFFMDKCNNLAISVLIFLISGILCSIIDRIFWGGSLDYICFYTQWVNGYISYTIDLKDVYLDIMFVLFFFLLTIFAIKYLKLCKDERKKFAYNIKKWIKSGCPSK